MKNRTVTAAALVGALLLGPAALAAPGGTANIDHDVEAAADGALDHAHPEGDKEGDADDHDHDGDGRPDHDAEDHDKDEDDERKPKPKPGTAS